MTMINSVSCRALSMDLTALNASSVNTVTNLLINERQDDAILVGEVRAADISFLQGRELLIGNRGVARNHEMPCPAVVGVAHMIGMHDRQLTMTHVQSQIAQHCVHKSAQRTKGRRGMGKHTERIILHKSELVPHRLDRWTVGIGIAKPGSRFGEPVVVGNVGVAQGCFPVCSGAGRDKSGIPGSILRGQFKAGVDKTLRLAFWHWRAQVRSAPTSAAYQ